MSRYFDFEETDLFSVWMRRRRELLGITQEDLASLTGISQPNLSAYEKGARIPSAGMRQRIMDAMVMRPSQALEACQDEILDLFEEYGQRNPRVFGSVAYGDDNPDSDIDFILAPGGEALGFRYYRLMLKLMETTTFPVDIIRCDPETLDKTQLKQYQQWDQEAIRLEDVRA